MLTPSDSHTMLLEKLTEDFINLGICCCHDWRFIMVRLLRSWLAKGRRWGRFLNAEWLLPCLRIGINYWRKGLYIGTLACLGEQMIDIR